LLSAPAAAHTTVTPYDLPIPFSVYVYAVVGTLVPGTSHQKSCRAEMLAGRKAALDPA